jgi:HK97 family phage prohead protease
MRRVKFLSQPEFIGVRRRGQPSGAGVMRRGGTVLRTDDVGDQPIRRFVFSDGSIDRMNDRVDPDGWELSAFRRNPTILWAHDATIAPIGRAPSVFSDGYRLLGDVEFAVEVNAFAKTIFDLVAAGFVKACSVGFRALEYSFSKDRPGGIDYICQELLEVSICPLPANANSLVEARSFGIDTRPISRWAERALDAGGNPTISMHGLMQLRSTAREPVRTRADRVAIAAARKRRLIRDGVMPAQVHRSPSPDQVAQQEADRRREAAAVIDHLSALAAQW